MTQTNRGKNRSRHTSNHRSKNRSHGRDTRKNNRLYRYKLHGRNWSAIAIGVGTIKDGNKTYHYNPELSLTEGGKTHHFRFQKKLGVGADGMVLSYKNADPKSTFKTVAIKFFQYHSDYLAEKYAYNLLSNNSKMKGYIPRYYGSIETEDYRGVVIQQFKLDLFDRIEHDSRNLNFQQSVSYLKRLSDIIKEFHSNGVCINDLKSENLMIDHRDKIHLIDLCLTGKQALKNFSRHCHTVEFDPPDLVYENRDRLCQQSNDMWSFGILCYRMFLDKIWPTVDPLKDSQKYITHPYTSEEILHDIKECGLKSNQQKWLRKLLIGTSQKVNLQGSSQTIWKGGLLDHNKETRLTSGMASNLFHNFTG